MEIHHSARRHGINDNDIAHATDHPIVVVDLEPDADPPKLLVIGPDRAGNLLEVLVLTLAEGRMLAIHAMPMRKKFQNVLAAGGSQDG